MGLAIGCCYCLVGVAAAGTETCWRPEAKRFFDCGEGVRNAVEEVGVLFEEVRGGSGIFAEDVVVFHADSM